MITTRTHDRLISFALATLGIMEDDSDWGSDTLDDLARAAHEHQLATENCNGEFLLPSHIRHLDAPDITPVRIRRERTRGWRLPPATICVTRPGPWGNPFKDMSPDKAVSEFQRWLARRKDHSAIWMHRHLDNLKGKDLACWCPTHEPCHADVLLRLANARDILAIHDPDSDENDIYLATKEEDCLSETHLTAFRTCLQQRATVAIGRTVAEPLRFNFNPIIR